VRPTTTTSSTTSTTIAGGTTTTTVKPHEHERECRKFNKRRGDRCEPRTNLPWFRVLGL
jgi:hypothetical protein